MDYSLLGNNVLKDHRRPTSRAFRDVGLGTLERTRYLPKNRGGFHIGGRHRAKASAIESCTGCNSSPPATDSPSPATSAASPRNTSQASRYFSNRAVLHPSSG